MQAIREEFQKREMADCTFNPTRIRSRVNACPLRLSPAAASRLSVSADLERETLLFSQGAVDPKLHQRLYLLGLEQKKQRQRMHERRQMQREESALKECTFKPDLALSHQTPRQELRVSAFSV